MATCGITGMTGSEKSTVQDSWKLIGSYKKDNGVALFLSVFSAYPDAMEHFYHFEGRSLDFLKGQTDMRAHGAAVMYAMDSLVDNLIDPECLVALIRKIARNHKGRNIGKSRFEQLRGLYGAFLDSSLGAKSTAETKAAWDKFLKFLSNTIDKEQKQVRT